MKGTERHTNMKKTVIEIPPSSWKRGGQQPRKSFKHDGEAQETGRRPKSSCNTKKEGSKRDDPLELL
ncbi:MAG: hypothetical protein AAB610_02085 [Patescibacteria group bacterium]